MPRYSAEVKSNALKRAEEVGITQAAQELHISSQSISSWRKATKNEPATDSISAEAYAILNEQYQAKSEELEQCQKEKVALQARLDRALRALNTLISD